jgi:serine/threonine-protein kinase
LADLGIATAAERTSVTQSDVVLGTASYMAPEQLAGGQTGPPTDVYALAAVAFEALSGRKARTGRTPLEVAHEVVSGPAPDLRAAGCRAPAAAAEILARGMARDPNDRPPSAGALAADLRRALSLRDSGPAIGATAATAALAADGSSAASQPTAAPHARREPGAGGAPPETAGRPRAAPGRPSRNGRLAPALAALAVILVAAFAGVAALVGGDPDDARDAGQQREAAAGGGEGGTRSEPQRAGTEGSEPDGEPAPQASAAQEEAPSSDAPEPAGDPVALNDRGYELMQAGDYEGAIPLLEQAVAAYPEGSQELTYAYALYNLGRSLRLAGRPDEAVPILERRLRIPNQTETVQRELDLARAAS